jgi:hypothetical protein
MLKILKYAIVTNLLLAILFLYSNFALWNLVNTNNPRLLITDNWNPLIVATRQYNYVEGIFSMDQTVNSYINTPFWIFFVALGINLYFIYRLSKQKRQ